MKDIASISAEQKQTKEMSPRRIRAGKFMGRVGLAAVCLIPAADFWLSDAVTAKEYELIQENTTLNSKAAERGVETSATISLGILESLAAARLIKSKKARGAFSVYDEYQKNREQELENASLFKKTKSKVAHAPMGFFLKVGEAFNKAGEKLSKRESKIVRAAGKLALDTGQVNIMGTSGIVMNETMEGKPTSISRQLYLSGLIMGTWVGMAEGVRQAYRSVPALRPPMASVGRGLEMLTTIDVTNPASTPLGIAAFGTAAYLFGREGWRVETFRQRREETIGVQQNQVQQAIDEFYANNPF